MAIERKSRTGSTITFTVFAVIFAIISSYTLTFNINQELAKLSGEGAGGAIAAPFLVIFMVIFSFIAFAAGIAAIPFLICTLIFNVRSSVRWQKIVSWVDVAAFSYVIGVAIYKLIELLILKG